MEYLRQPKFNRVPIPKESPNGMVSTTVCAVPDKRLDSPRTSTTTTTTTTTTTAIVTGTGSYQTNDWW